MSLIEAREATEHDSPLKLNLRVKSASTTWNRANKVGLVSSAASARGLGRARRDLLLLDLEDGEGGAEGLRLETGSQHRRL